MTVKEMIQYLQAVDDDSRIVVVSSDSEGNAYSALGACDEHIDGESYFWRDDDRELWSEEDAEPDEPTPPENAQPCIVIWPA